MLSFIFFLVFFRLLLDEVVGFQNKVCKGSKSPPNRSLGGKARSGYHCFGPNKALRGEKGFKGRTKTDSTKKHKKHRRKQQKRNIRKITKKQKTGGNSGKFVDKNLYNVYFSETRITIILVRFQK